MKNKINIGYTTGVFDMFHIGHLNLLRRARENCDYLIVGVSDDNLVQYKGKKPVIPFEERIEIVRSIRYVDEVRIQSNLDKVIAWQEIGYSTIFVGDDWKGTPRWKEYEKQLSEHGVSVVFLPYTKGTSSTLIQASLNILNEQPFQK